MGCCHKSDNFNRMTKYFKDVQRRTTFYLEIPRVKVVFCQLKTLIGLKGFYELICEKLKLKSAIFWATLNVKRFLVLFAWNKPSKFQTQTSTLSTLPRKSSACVCMYVHVEEKKLQNLTLKRIKIPPWTSYWPHHGSDLLYYLIKLIYCF